MLFPVDASHPLPLYAQLERGIRAAVMTGRLRAGQQLPTVRQLAVDLKINANTVAKVYSELEGAGLLETRRGVGTFVRAAHPPAGGARDRERELRLLGERFLEEAAGLGFDHEEVAHQLMDRLKREKRSHE